MARLGTQLEACNALRDVQYIMNDRGDIFYIFLRGESEVVRDKYNSIKTVNTTYDFSMYCYPFISNPTQDQMNKAGIYQKADAIVYTAYKSWTDNGYTINDIDTLRSTILYDEQSYQIKEKNNSNQIGDLLFKKTIFLR